VLFEDFDPPYADEQAISLSPADPQTIPRAAALVAITVEPIGTAATVGLRLPLEVVITPPQSASRGTAPERRTFRRLVPSEITFRPREGGPHLVLVREVVGNLFWGALVVDVQGDLLFE
jgi:hypothetical protein